MTAKIIPINLSIAPAWLPLQARVHWDKFYQAADSVCEVFPGDILALAPLVDAWAEYQEIRRYLADNGNTFDTAEGPELRPEYWLMSKA